MAVKWKEVLTHPVAVKWYLPKWKVYLTHPVAVKWKEVLTPPCGSEMERGTYPTLWQ